MNRPDMLQIPNVLGNHFLNEFCSHISKVGNSQEIFPCPVELEPVLPELSFEDLTNGNPPKIMVRKAESKDINNLQRMKIWAQRKNERNTITEESLIKLFPYVLF